MTYCAPEQLRALKTDLNLSSSRSEILRQVSYSPAYHFYRINSSLLLINSFMLPSPPSPPHLSLQIIDNKIPPEQKLHPNLAAPAVFRGMIFCFFSKNSISCKISVGAPVSGFSLPIVSLVSLPKLTVINCNEVFLQSSEEVTL